MEKSWNSNNDFPMGKSPDYLAIVTDGRDQSVAGVLN